MKRVSKKRKKLVNKNQLKKFNFKEAILYLMNCELESQPQNETSEVHSSK